jgi:hypothetical protein
VRVLRYFVAALMLRGWVTRPTAGMDLVLMGARLRSSSDEADVLVVDTEAPDVTKGARALGVHASRRRDEYAGVVGSAHGELTCGTMLARQDQAHDARLR